MKRFTALFALTLLFVASFISAGWRTSGADAQEAGAVHPIVGIWIADTDPEITENADSVFSFSPDGAYTELHPDGEVLIGRWESTGDTTATLTIVSTMMNEDETDAGVFVIRASVEVAADSATFSANYTFEIINPDGSTAGQAGPGAVEGRRIEVEAPGDPVMSLEAMFTLFEGGGEATPAP